MNIDEEDFASDSDDADYVPSDGEAVSEEENSGEEEESEVTASDTNTEKKSKTKQQRAKKTTSALQARKRKGGIKLDDEEQNDAENEKDEEDGGSKQLAEAIKKEQEERKDEEEKKRSDDLWASFLSDVGGPKPSRPAAKPTQTPPLSKPTKTTTSVSAAKPSGTKNGSVTITKLFDFAGETVKVTKQVDANSKEAKQEEAVKSSDAAAPSSSSGIKRASGGLGSVLGMINKKPKISTLGKSKLDWESFKSEEGICEELQIHNRGKKGYIERQNFLNRTDQRQFEIERDIRMKTSGKR